MDSFSECEAIVNVKAVSAHSLDSDSDCSSYCSSRALGPAKDAIIDASSEQHRVAVPHKPLKDQKKVIQESERLVRETKFALPIAVARPKSLSSFLAGLNSESDCKNANALLNGLLSSSPNVPSWLGKLDAGQQKKIIGAKPRLSKPTLDSNVVLIDEDGHSIAVHFAPPAPSPNASKELHSVRPKHKKASIDVLNDQVDVKMREQANQRVAAKQLGNGGGKRRLPIPTRGLISSMANSHAERTTRQKEMVDSDIEILTDEDFNAQQDKVTGTESMDDDEFERVLHSNMPAWKNTLAFPKANRSSHGFLEEFDGPTQPSGKAPVLLDVDDDSDGDGDDDEEDEDETFDLNALMDVAAEDNATDIIARVAWNKGSAAAPAEASTSDPGVPLKKVRIHQVNITQFLSGKFPSAPPVPPLETSGSGALPLKGPMESRRSEFLDDEAEDEDEIAQVDHLDEAALESEMNATKFIVDDESTDSVAAALAISNDNRRLQSRLILQQDEAETARLMSRFAPNAEYLSKTVREIQEKYAEDESDEERPGSSSHHFATAGKADLGSRNKQAPAIEFVGAQSDSGSSDTEPSANTDEDFGSDEYEDRAMPYDSPLLPAQQSSVAGLATTSLSKSSGITIKDLGVSSKPGHSTITNQARRQGKLSIAGKTLGTLFANANTNITANSTFVASSQTRQKLYNASTVEERPSRKPGTFLTGLPS